MNEAEREIAEQAIEVHNTLWNPVAEVTEYRGEAYPIVRRSEPTKKFAQADFVDPSDPKLIIRYVTHNLAKATDDTAWCRSSPQHKITWVITGIRRGNPRSSGRFTGAIKSDGVSYKLLKLHRGTQPDEVVYTRQIQILEPMAS